VSAYVPTNVISITDGQLYLEADLFYAGIRPAVNIGISVSRVGGDAQTKAMKQVAGQLKGDMAAFRELAAFATFGSDLDKSTQRQLDRGYRLTEILKQPQYQPVSLEDQVMTIYSGVRGLSDTIPVDQVRDWEVSFRRFMETTHPEVAKEIDEKKQLTPENEERLKAAVKEFNAGWTR
jgi:F-type H+-transporting ATPase subunit alpha